MPMALMEKQQDIDSWRRMKHPDWLKQGGRGICGKKYETRQGVLERVSKHVAFLVWWGVSRMQLSVPAYQK
jgi:hypothetical protein